MSEYKQLESIKKTYAILLFLSDQVGLVSGAEISQALNISQATVMSHLVTWEELDVVVRQENLYGLGMGVALLWTRKKRQLEAKAEQINKEIKKLEG